MLNQILQLKFYIAQLEAMIKHSEENLPRVSQERDYYKQGFERLSKENEQLKTELNECKANLEKSSQEISNDEPR